MVSSIDPRDFKIVRQWDALRKESYKTRILMGFLRIREDVPKPIMDRMYVEMLASNVADAVRTMMANLIRDMNRLAGMEFVPSDQAEPGDFTPSDAIDEGKRPILRIVDYIAERQASLVNTPWENIFNKMSDKLTAIHDEMVENRREFIRNNNKLKN